MHATFTDMVSYYTVSIIILSLFFCTSVACDCRFWYISLVSCCLNDSVCVWSYIPSDVVISYDIWMVNGHPNEVS